MLLTFVLPIFGGSYLGDLNHADPYSNPFWGLLSRLFVWVMSVLMSIAFINICPNTPWIAKQGRLTLQYFIYHAIIVYVLNLVVIKLRLPTSFFAATVYTLIVVVGLGIASKLSFFTKLTNPSLFFKKKELISN